MTVQKIRNTLLPIFLFLLICTSTNIVQAVRGTPGSAEFGIGITVHPDGLLTTETLAAMAELGPDWVKIPVQWSALQPDPAFAPRLETLDAMMRTAEINQIAALVSISGAPDWAQTAQGPDPARAAQLVLDMAQRYPTALQAVELFAGANTRQGWGAFPNPEAYLFLFRSVHELLINNQRSILLVAAGLRPVTGGSAEGDMPDTVFLQSLYGLGARELMQVISLQLPDLTGEPLALPMEKERRILRHYEEIRQVMITNGHQDGVIWITRFSPPSGKIQLQDSTYLDPNAQTTWISQAYIQLRSQLYIGVAFLESLNPEPEGAVEQGFSLLRRTGGNHPFFAVFREMIGLNKTGGILIKPGKPKEGNLGKKRP